MRPSWDEHFLRLAKTHSEMGTCNRLQVGACLVKHKHVLSLGFNGSPPGQPHCNDVGCLIIDGGCKRTIHAEINAINQALDRDLNITGSTIYLTHSPCESCAKTIVERKIKRVVFREKYRKEEPIQILINAGIEVVHLP